MADTTQIQVDPSNLEQRRAWDGDEGAHWATCADYYDRAVAVHHQAFMAAAGIGRSDRVLDVGCGTGQTTLAAARSAPAGAALGVDLSAAMLAVGRRRAREEGLTNAAFVQADAQVHPFEPQSCDIAISRTGAMFFGDPLAAFANLARALRRSGRLVLLVWQAPARQEWFLSFMTALSAGRDMPTPPPQAPSPFSLSDPQVIQDLLSGAGYADIRIDGRDAPMWFGTDADDATRFMLGQLGWMLTDLDSPTRAQAVASLRETMAAHESPQGVQFASSTWTVTATRA